MAFARSLMRRSVDWAALGSKLTSDTAKAELSRLRAVSGEITALSNTYSSPPPPIDFAAYKSKISADGVVEKFESEYNSISYPTFVAEELGEIKAKHEAMIAAAETSVADSEARIKVLNDLVSSMENNMVGPRTTLDQLYELYPDLQEEIEAEIDAHEWGKDIQ